MGEYEIREYQSGDEVSLLATFNEVFAAANPAFVPRTRAQWEWAFRQNPGGTRVFLALYDGRVVAQYAALPYRVTIDGRQSSFAQIVDSMVHPEHRTGLKRPGLFVQTALPFFDAYGGPERDLVHYGWPIEQAWRIGKTFLEYEVVRTQPFLVHETDAGSEKLPEGVEVLERFGPEVLGLYERCRLEWPASTIRDAAFLHWRFIDNPFHRYEVLAVRDAGRLLGYAVWRAGNWMLDNMGIVADWLVPRDEHEVGDLLARAVVSRSRAVHTCVTATIFPEWSPWFERLQEHGFLVRPSEYFMVARNFHRRYDMLWLRDGWWYQLADTDLV